MNPKISKLRTERGKNERKISDLQARNKEINALIYELENTDIIGLVRASGMTADQLAALISGKPEGKSEKVEETDDEEN